ncbi:MAG: CRISPR-associated ring nuclease [Myxococcota bacterium]
MPEARRKVFVIAVVGMSPAVVTELLWHLVVVDGVDVVGVELWTTGHLTRKSGVRSLADRYGWLADLSAALGDAGDRLPAFPAEFDYERPPSGGWSDRPLRVVVPHRPDGDPIDDIATEADATEFGAQLHDRLRRLRGVGATPVPPGIELIGSLAGGRKTMSAALQTAFSLQAPAPARLVHLWVHPSIENDRTLLPEFAFPVGSVKGLAPEEQVTVYDVPFLPIRELVHGTSFVKDLDVRPFTELCGELTRLALGTPSAHVDVHQGSHRIALRRGGVVVHPPVPIHDDLVRIMRMIKGTPDGVHLQDVHAALGKNRDADSTARWVDRATAQVASKVNLPLLREFLPHRPDHSGRWRIDRIDDLSLP